MFSKASRNAAPRSTPVLGFVRISETRYLRIRGIFAANDSPQPGPRTTVGRRRKRSMSMIP